jgi:phosphoesterase RecJ-like protein
MTSEASIAELLALIHPRQTFVITSHTRPDGDAIGSSLGLMHLLEAMGKQATVVFTDAIPGIYGALPGVERIVAELPSAPADALVLLECGSLERSSLDLAAYAAAPPAFTINIDHHSSGKPFAGFNWIDPEAAAVGAMIYDVAIASGLPLNKAISDCLYTAILTDTGAFTYSSTTAATFAMAQHLVESGADPARIAQAVYFSNAPGKVHVLGTVLNKMRIEGGVAWSDLTLEEIERAHAVIEDCEGVVNHLIAIAGIEAAVFLREIEPDSEFRLSLRSKGRVDVARIAELFGGGGHRNASGCNMQGSLAGVSGRVLTAIHQAIAAAPTAPELC